MAAPLNLDEMRRLILTGAPAEAAALMRAAGWAEAGDAEQLYCLAIAERDSGELEAALRTVIAASESDPSRLDAAMVAAELLLACGQADQAMAWLARVEDRFHAQLMFWLTRSRIAQAAGRAAEAAQFAVSAVERDPGHWQARYQLGLALNDIRSPRAREQLEAAVALAPDQEPVWQSLFLHVLATGTYEDASDMLDRFERAHPCASLHFHRSNLEWAAGNFDAAVESVQRVFDPAFDQAGLASDIKLQALVNRCYLLAFNFPERVKDRLAAADQLAQTLAPNADQLAPQTAGPAGADGRLRIGVLGGCLQWHVSSDPLLAFLRHLDRSKYELYCYRVDHKPADAVTEELRQLSDGWREFAPSDGFGQAAAIRNDEIDILLYVSWFLEGHAVEALSYHPAKLQIAWLNADGFSGLPFVDWWLSNDSQMYAGSPEPRREKIYRAGPLHCAFTPPTGLNVPNGRVDSTERAFASFCSIKKLNQPVFDTWSEILRRVPESVLVLKPYGASPGVLTEKINRMAVQAQIAPERLVILPFMSREAHFQAFNQVDVMLDPFPTAGGNAVMEALWMGLPIAVLAGQFPLERLGYEFLAASDRLEWAVSSVADYIDLAVGFMEDADLRARLRNTQREHLMRSRLFDGAGVARVLERALDEMWYETLPMEISPQ